MITSDTNVVPEWAAGSDILEGVEIDDKAQFVGKPLMLTDVWFATGSTNVSYVYAQGRLADGSEFTINDSSTTGVRYQLWNHFVSKGCNPTDGEVFPAKIFCPTGLRVSTYEVSDKGKTKTAKTYYLTTSGQPVGAGKAAAKSAR